MVLSLNDYEPKLSKMFGYYFDQQMMTGIVGKAVDEALLNRKISTDNIFHSVLGSQSTSSEHEVKLKDRGICDSYSSKSCFYDNSGIESFHTLLKKHVYQWLTYQMFGGNMARNYQLCLWTF